MAVRRRLNVLVFVVFFGLVCIGHSVNAKPWNDETENSYGFDYNGSDRESTGINPAVIVLYVAVYGALAFVPILCCLCCRACCCRSAPPPSTTIIYQHIDKELPVVLPTSISQISSVSSAVPPPYQKFTPEIHI